MPQYIRYRIVGGLVFTLLIALAAYLANRDEAPNLEFHYLHLGERIVETRRHSSYGVVSLATYVEAGEDWYIIQWIPPEGKGLFVDSEPFKKGQKLVQLTGQGRTLSVRLDNNSVGIHDVTLTNAPGVPGPYASPIPFPPAASS